MRQENGKGVNLKGPGSDHAKAIRVADVFTTGMVAKLCRVAPRTVSKWFDSGRLKGYRIPGSNDRRISRQDLIKFMLSNNLPLNELGTGIRTVYCLTPRREVVDCLTEGASGMWEVFVKPSLTDFIMDAVDTPPQAALLDWNQGSDVCTGALRACKRLKVPCVVGISPDDSDGRELVDGGCHHVFHWPCDGASLSRAIFGMGDKVPTVNFRTTRGHVLPKEGEVA